MSQFQYRIEHVDGAQNVMPDIMTRWLRGYRGKRSAIKRVSHRILEHVLPASPLNADFITPSVTIIRDAQHKSRRDLPSSAQMGPDTLWTINDRIWIPDEAEDLQVLVLISVHGGEGGHRGQKPTESVLRERFTWTTLSHDTQDFISACVHCIMAKTGHKIPRPLATTVHATKPNHVIHFDFFVYGT